MMATMDASVKDKEFQGEPRKEGSQEEAYRMEVMCSALISKEKQRSSLMERFFYVIVRIRSFSWIAIGMFSLTNVSVRATY